MPYFARRLEYAANDGDAGASFVALIEVAKKKGGNPIEFLLYRYSLQYRDKEGKFEMIRLQDPKTSEEARVYWMFREKSKYPGHQSPLWQKTTSWLYAVGVGGGYEQYPKGSWVRVGRPSPWKLRRKRRRLKFGNPRHIILALESQICAAVERKRELIAIRSEVLSYDEVVEMQYVAPRNRKRYDEIDKMVRNTEAEIDFLNQRITNIKDELRFKWAHLRGIDFFPRREDGTLQRIAENA